MKYALNILLLFTLFQSSAQNLVPNPSFESYTTCPDNENQVDSATGWYNFLLTPDYYNSCSSNYNYSTPNNLHGYQVPATGNAYCGLFAYWSPFLVGDTNIRENIGCQLQIPLTIGVKYYVSFKANLSLGINGGCACNSLGVKFSSNSYNSYATDSLSSPLINGLPHIAYSTIITDTINWTHVSGSFIADSAYSYLTIGIFNNDFEVDTLLMGDTTGMPPCYAYYFIDDVCVSTDSLTCAGNVGIKELSKPVRKLIRIVDTMGRETEDKPNTLLIYIYSDGTKEKVFRVK